jgi:hypothetical protein
MDDSKLEECGAFGCRFFFINTTVTHKETMVDGKRWRSAIDHRGRAAGM